MAHEFEIRNQIEVDATPEEVWEAIATGPGVDSWFMGRNEIEPREGGKTRMTLADFTEEATVTAWEPPTRFATRGPEGEDGSFHAFEFLVEGRSGGSTVVRWVHSGMLGEDWEAEYNGLREGDPVYLRKLGHYLTYFRGRHATPIEAFGPVIEDRERAWSLFRDGLGLPGPAALSDRVTLSPEGLERIEGTVDELTPSFLGVRSDHALYRFIYGYNGTVVIGHHLFAEGVDGAKAQQAWQDWITRTFA